jgi:hypothetical protein
MAGHPDIGDILIVMFIATIFTAGAIVVYRFMRGGKK